MRLVSTTTHPLPGYALGHSDHETSRLILQHQLYGPITRQLLLAAGVSRGMKVLDVGSGAGDVALLLADLVGPTGQVVGVDANPAILETARARTRAAGWSNVRLVEGDLADLPIDDDDFDAVVGRWILMYLADPAGLIARLATRLKPGGVLAFQESDLRSGAQTFPPVPVHEQLRAWMAPQDELAGPAVAMGPQLFADLRRGGPPPPRAADGCPDRRRTPVARLRLPRRERPQPAAVHGAGRRRRAGDDRRRHARRPPPRRGRSRVTACSCCPPSSAAWARVRG